MLPVSLTESATARIPVRSRRQAMDWSLVLLSQGIETTILPPGEDGNWSLLVPGIMFVLVIAGIGIVVVPFFRHVVAMSVYEYFGQRFGTPVRMYASFTFALGHFSKMGFVFYLLALSVAGFTGWPIALLIIAVCGVVGFLLRRGTPRID